ncbi:Vesicle-fusing ATPase [Gracilariopsis chorda]|uniref:Vesicle-fusing ATPase n=1 Tax=Gracilariopsis chorda TaxID=448386 RepID=A0A2V3J2T1_9FLOR|nr:Vesicle-fusing ATPase [Gracilariopsis chorda]|eukprot:PXF48756.1 Vesicle-fusing ATPase [Gracilariopsis chorda]
MSRWNFGNLGLSPATIKLIASSCPSNDLARTNKVFVNPSDLRTTSELAIINSKFVYVVSSHEGVEPSQIGFNAIQRRELRLAIRDHVEVTPLEWSKKSSIEAKAATFEVDLVSKRAGPIEAEADEITPLCVRNLVGHVSTVGQSYVIDFYGSSLLLKCTSLVAESTVERAILKPTTEFYFAKAPGSGVKIKGGDSRPKDVFRSDFDFEKMGIGGLDKEFSDIFRRAFASRVFPPAVIQKLGIQHVKGMLLYGPPGTGKTLIARQIGKMLNGKEPKVVNGPEILNKYVGQSEENIRNLFQDAETEYAEQGDSSELHIIIFDEIDAICKQRGSTNSSSGVGDTVVNQLLSKIDGVNALNNILVIGMTNRKDMIDEALLRPGRLEVHVEISLPDETGRQQILRIHTAKMQQNGMLDRDVNLETIAAETKNYSGAEIEGLCKSAAAFALNRHVDYRDLKKEVDTSGVRVTMNDFQRALVEVQPAFGMGKDDFARCLLGGFLIHGDRVRKALEAGKLFRNEVASSDRSPLLSILIEGPPGTGKTALAALLAVESGFPFVRLISPESFVGYSDFSKCQALAKVFDDAHKSSLSVIVLDNVERIFEWTPIGPRFSNSVLQTLMILAKQVPPKGRRLLILATTSNIQVMERLDFKQAFSAILSTQTMERNEIESVLDGTAESMNISQQADGTLASLHSSGLTPTLFRSLGERDMAVSLLENEQLGVKKLLMILNMARTPTSDGQHMIELDRLRAVLEDVL